MAPPRRVGAGAGGALLTPNKLQMGFGGIPRRQLPPGVAPSAPNHECTRSGRTAPSIPEPVGAQNLRRRSTKRGRERMISITQRQMPGA
jgi:hypothetical protein